MLQILLLNQEDTTFQPYINNSLPFHCSLPLVLVYNNCCTRINNKFNQLNLTSPQCQPFVPIKSTNADLINK